MCFFWGHIILYIDRNNNIVILVGFKKGGLQVGSVFIPIYFKLLKILTFIWGNFMYLYVHIKDTVILGPERNIVVI